MAYIKSFGKRSRSRGRSRSRRSLSVKRKLSYGTRSRSLSRMSGIARGVSAVRRASRSRSRYTNKMGHRNFSNAKTHGEFDRSKIIIKLSGKSVVPKLYKKAQFNFRDQYWCVLSSLEGQQGCYDIGIQGQCSDFMVPNGQTTPYGLGYFAGISKPLFDQNPLQKITGNQFGYDPTVPYTEQICVRTCRLKMEITNLESAAAMLDIYVWVAKTAVGGTTTAGVAPNKDALTGAGDAREGLFSNSTGCAPPVNRDHIVTNSWDRYLSYKTINGSTGLGSGAPTYISALGSFVVSTVGVPQANFLGQKPYQCRELMKEFKLLKTKSYDLSGDTNILVDLDIDINKMVDKQYLATIATKNGVFEPRTAIPGLTTYVTAVVRGQPVWSTYGSADNNKGMTTAAARVGVICSREWICTPAPGKSIQTAINYNYLMSNDAPTGANVAEATVRASEKFDNVVDTVAGVVSAIAG